MKKKILLSLCSGVVLSAGLLPISSYAVSAIAAKNTKPDVIAYALLGSPGDMAQLKTTLEGYQGHYPFTQLDVSFMSPTMNPPTIQSDITQGNYSQLFSAAFFAVDAKPPYATATGAQGDELHSLVTTLTAKGVGVYFSVGGWAYSNGNQANSSNENVSTTFPLTSDILKDFQTYKPAITTNPLWLHADNQDGGYVGSHIAFDDKYLTKDLTDTWVSVAKAFGATGVDLDYEEQWFPAQVQKKIKDLLPAGHQWSFRNNFATIKYAAYIKSLEQSAATDKLGVSIAAPSIGAFNVNAVVGDDKSAGNFFYPAGNTAPLKGVMYNMAHPNEAGLTALNSLFFMGNSENILNGLSSIGVMSYDLDDGNVPLTSYWCIGWNKAGYPQARDPIHPGGKKNISCSVIDQTLAIANSFNALGLTSHVDMGVEAYYPNYPVDPNAPMTSLKYRWNDAFLPFDIPVKAGLEVSTSLPFALAGTDSENPTAAATTHFWLVPKQLAAALKAKSNGVIFWSLNNAEKSVMYSDRAAITAKDSSVFSVYKAHMSDFIIPLMANAEDWDQVIKDLYGVYYPTPLAKAGLRKTQ